MSNPTLQEYSPDHIPWQRECIDFYNGFDFSQGVLEMLLSGSVGSAKSVQAVHMMWLHAINNPGSKTLVLREVLKDLKRTIWPLIIGHYSDAPHIVKSYNKSEMKITLTNGSEIIADSYHDGDLEKFRSLELSMAVIEEASESNRKLYEAVYMRLGRCVGVNENIFLTLTNPDGLDHYLYTDIIEKEGGLKKVFYSLTEQNPFLPKWYVENLKKNLDEKMALRMLKGQWVDIFTEGVYYNYDPQVNFKSEEYKINENEPIYIAHDFNIGKGKPMSCALGQIINETWHWFKSYHVEGARTLNIMEEMANDNVFEYSNFFIVNGDATGRSRDTRSIKSDYDIIEEFLANYKRQDNSSLEFEIDVPRSNPAIKKRHALTNASFKNMNDEINFYTYDKWVNTGFMRTKFKKDSYVIEDDSLPEQHVTTAIGYSIYRHSIVGDNKGGTIQL